MSVRAGSSVVYSRDFRDVKADVARHSTHLAGRTTHQTTQTGTVDDQ
jgi:hypothetical protein